jgi:hypothetical protein
MSWSFDRYRLPETAWRCFLLPLATREFNPAQIGLRTTRTNALFVESFPDVEARGCDDYPLRHRDTYRHAAITIRRIPGFHESTFAILPFKRCDLRETPSQERSKTPNSIIPAATTGR